MVILKGRKGTETDVNFLLAIMGWPTSLPSSSVRRPTPNSKSKEKKEAYPSPAAPGKARTKSRDRYFVYRNPKIKITSLERSERASRPFSWRVNRGLVAFVRRGRRVGSGLPSLYLFCLRLNSTCWTNRKEKMEQLVDWPKKVHSPYFLWNGCGFGPNQKHYLSRII